MIMIAPLPVTVGSTQVESETRGSTVVLLIDPARFENWIGQLSDHLHARAAASLGAQLA